MGSHANDDRNRFFRNAESRVRQAYGVRLVVKLMRSISNDLPDRLEFLFSRNIQAAKEGNQGEVMPKALRSCGANARGFEGSSRLLAGRGKLVMEEVVVGAVGSGGGGEG